MSEITTPRTIKPRPSAPAADVAAAASLLSAVTRFGEAHGRHPVVGVDLDGVTADTVSGLRAWMGDKLGVAEDERLSRFPEPDVYAMWLGENAWFTDITDFMTHFGHAETTGFYLGLNVYARAAVTLAALRDAGVSLVAVTARGSDTNADTLAWIREHKLPLDTVLHSGSDKHAVDGIDVFIDDAPPVITGLLAGGHKVIIFEQGYNAGLPAHESAVRVGGWGTPMITAVAGLLR